MENVAVTGASPETERYSTKAIQRIEACTLVLMKPNPY